MKFCELSTFCWAIILLRIVAVWSSDNDGFISETTTKAADLEEIPPEDDLSDSELGEMKNNGMIDNLTNEILLTQKLLQNASDPKTEDAGIFIPKIITHKITKNKSLTNERPISRVNKNSSELLVSENSKQKSSGLESVSEFSKQENFISGPLQHKPENSVYNNPKNGNFTTYPKISEKENSISEPVPNITEKENPIPKPQQSKSEKFISNNPKKGENFTIDTKISEKENSNSEPVPKISKKENSIPEPLKIKSEKLVSNNPKNENFATDPKISEPVQKKSVKENSISEPLQTKSEKFISNNPKRNSSNTDPKISEKENSISEPVQKISEKPDNSNDTDSNDQNRETHDNDDKENMFDETKPENDKKVNIDTVKATPKIPEGKREKLGNNINNSRIKSENAMPITSTSENKTNLEKIEKIKSKSLNEQFVDIAKKYERKLELFKNELGELKFKNPTFLNITNIPAVNLENFSFLSTAEGKNILVLTNSIGTILYEPIISYSKVFLRKVFFNDRQIHEKFEILQTVIVDDVLWIAEASSNKLSIIKSNLQGQNSNRLVKDLKVKGMHLFSFKNEVMLVLYHSDTLKVFKVFSSFDGYKLNLIQSKNFRCKNGDENVKFSSFEENNSTFILVACKNLVDVWKFSKNNFKLVQTLDSQISANEIKTYKNKFTEKRFVYFSNSKATVVFWWYEISLIKWTDLQLNGVVKSVITVDFQTILITEKNSKVFLEKKNGESSEKMQNFKTNCNKVDNIFSKIYNDRLLLVYSCLHHGKREIVFLNLLYATLTKSKHFKTKKPELEEKLERCLNKLDDTLKHPNKFKRIEEKASNTKFDFNEKEAIEYPATFDLLKIKNKIYGKNLIIQPHSVYVDEKLAKLREKYTKLDEKLKNLDEIIPNLMTFNTNQHITTTIDVPKMIATNASILSLQLENLSGSPFRAYKSKYLNLKEDQTVRSDVKFDAIATKNIDVTTFRGNGTKIFYANLVNSSSDEQVIFGKPTFTDVEIINNIERIDPQNAIKINGISTDDFVLQGSNVEFDKSLQLKNQLTVGSLNVRYLNGEKFDVWRNTNSLIADAGPQVLLKNLVVKGNAYVDGKVKAGLIDGVNLADLYENGVKKVDERQVIEGPVKFENSLAIKKLNVNKVNGIKWDSILKMEDFHVKANIHIKDAYVQNNLNSNNINGIDLDKEVMISGPDQKVKGKIAFVSDVKVTGPGMRIDEGATLNNIEPSKWFESKLFPSGSVSSISYLDKAEIGGDVQIKNFPDFENDYWQKSKKQVIPVDIELKNATFEKSVDAKTLNSFSTSEYMLKNTVQIFKEQNIFVENVTVTGHVIMKNGATANDFDLSNITERAITLHEDQVIHGNLTFQKGIEVDHLIIKDDRIGDINIDENFAVPRNYDGNLAFTGNVSAETVLANKNLKVDYINNESYENVLQPTPRKVSKIIGKLTLGNATTNDLYIYKNLNGKNFKQWLRNIPNAEEELEFLKPFKIQNRARFLESLTIKNLNSKPYDEFVNQIAKACSHTVITGTKHFKHLTVSNLSRATRINNVKLEEFWPRLLSKSKEQNITGFYTFEKDTIFKNLNSKKLSDITVSDIVFMDQAEHLPGTVTFIGDVETKANINSKSGWINNCNIKDILNPPLDTTDGIVRSDMILGQVNIIGNITVSPAGKLLVGDEKKDAINFLQNVVRKSKAEKIEAETKFGEIIVKSLISKKINDLPTDRFLKKLADNQNSSKLACDLTFRQLIVNKTGPGEIWFGNINGIPAETIRDHSVPKHSSITIKGAKEFLEAKMSGNTIVKNLNGTKFDEFMKFDDSLKDETLQFDEKIRVMENIQVTGLIGNHKTDDLLKPFLFSKSEKQPNFIPDNYDRFTIAGYLKTQQINGIKLADVVLKKAEEPQILTGRKTFNGGVKVVGGVHIENVNGIHLKNFEDDLHGKPEIALHKNQKSASPRDKILKLEKYVLKLDKLNEINKQMIAGMHSKLSHISEEDRVRTKPIVDLVATQFGSMSSVAAVAEYDGSTKGSCDKFATYEFKITNSTLKKSHLLLGVNLNLPIDGFSNRLVQYQSSCDKSGTFSKFNTIEVKKEVFATISEKYLGEIKSIKQFYSNGKFYSVISSRTRPGLKLLNSNFDIINKFATSGPVSSIELAKDPCNNLVLFVTIDGDSLESLILFWNKQKKTFYRYKKLSSATTGKFATYGEKLYLFVGKEATSSHMNKLTEHALKVFVSKKCKTFKQFTTAAISQVSDVQTFEAYDDLYVVVVSYKENCIFVYRMIEMEGLELVETFSVERPSAIVHLKEDGTNYLVVVSDYNKVILLKLHFRDGS